MSSLHRLRATALGLAAILGSAPVAALPAVADSSTVTAHANATSSATSTPDVSSRLTSAAGDAAGLTTAGVSTGGAGGPKKLTWAPPKLIDPVTLTVPDDGQVTHLPTDQDFRLLIKGTVHGTLHVDGGDDVVVVGGTVDSGTARAGYFQNQAGTLHVQGVRWVSTSAHEGIDLAEPKGSTVQLENLDLGQVNGSYTTHHADVLQTWAGPTRLRVDRVTARTTYQGFFLLPGQHTTDKGPWFFDLRHVVIYGTTKAKYLLWVPELSSAFHLSLTDVVAVKTGPDAVQSQTVWSGGPAGVEGVKITSSAASPLLARPGSGYAAAGLTADSGGFSTPSSTTTSQTASGLASDAASGQTAATSQPPVLGGSTTNAAGASGTSTSVSTASGQGAQQHSTDWLWSWLGQD